MRISGRSGSELGYAPKTIWSSQGKLSVQYDACRCQILGRHRDLLAVFVGKTSSNLIIKFTLIHQSKEDQTHCVLCRAEGGRNSNLTGVWTFRLLLQIVYHRLRRVDGRSAADGDNYIGASLLEGLYSMTDSRDWSMLPDLAKGVNVCIVRFENYFYGLDNISLQRAYKASGKSFQMSHCMEISTF